MPLHSSKARRAGLAPPDAAPKNQPLDIIGGLDLKHPGYRTATRDREVFNAIRLRFAERGHVVVRLADQTFLATCWGNSKVLTGLQAVRHLATELGLANG